MDTIVTLLLLALGVGGLIYFLWFSRAATMRRDEVLWEDGLHKARLQEAEAMVASSEEILSGEPCIKGTRVPVHVVGAIARKHGVEEALATYPFLTRRQVELASVYVEAHPRKEQPPQTLLPKSIKRTRIRKVQPGDLQ
jgi:uncharacterized protein (DUF433 family)